MAENWQELDPGAPGHPLHVPEDRQGGSRFDSPGRYVALYAARTRGAAVGEVFGRHERWTPGLIERPTTDGRVRSLAGLDLEPGVLIDLDDASRLDRLGRRPSDVVRRNRELTQELAHRLWLEHGASEQGLSWWSYWRPEWTVSMVWSTGLDPVTFEGVTVAEGTVEPLTFDHPAVAVAGAALHRPAHRDG